MWNGHALEYQGQQYWISEGFTDYYARELLVRLGDLSGDDFLADFGRRMARYLGSRTDIGLHEAGDSKFDNTALVYEGGSVAALCLDLRIRAATSNKKSLDDLMRSLYADFAGAPHKSVTLADVIRATSTVAGTPFDDFFARHITGHETLPLSESLKLAGIQITPTIRDLPEVAWITTQLLQCPSMTALPGVGLKVLKSQGRSLREGDVISQVAGSPTRTFDDLRMAFGDLAPGATVDLTVTRDGQPTSLQVKLGGDPLSPPPRSRVVAVSVNVIGDPGPLALAIRESIFGPELTVSKDAR